MERDYSILNPFFLGCAFKVAYVDDIYQNILPCFVTETHFPEETDSTG